MQIGFIKSFSMKIYTKTGDQGSTALYGGTRVPKYHIRIESYGSVDELNSYLGLVRDSVLDHKIKELLTHIQERLFTLGAILATDPEKQKLKNGKERLNIPKIDEEDIQFLENKIDLMNENLSPMTHFILPGGHPTVSHCHIARCICRRAERLTTLLNEKEPINSPVLKYLNRLSDFLFVMARKLSYDMEVDELKWVPKKT